MGELLSRLFLSMLMIPEFHHWKRPNLCANLWNSFEFIIIILVKFQEIHPCKSAKFGVKIFYGELLKYNF